MGRDHDLAQLDSAAKKPVLVLVDLALVRLARFVGRHFKAACKMSVRCLAVEARLAGDCGDAEPLPSLSADGFIKL